MVGKIVLIDGNALVHRAYHALPPLTSPKGELVNAVYGVATMLLKVLPEIGPQYVAAAFDTPVPTFRHEEYEGYKAQRGPAPEGLPGQFARVDELLDALGIPVYRVDGFEADDLLGTMAKKATEAGLEVVILTGDQDAMQLVGPGVAVLTSRRGFTDTMLYDEPAVIERYGVRPRQLIDLKGLKGDASDNIPGVPGIGEKTASKLVSEYGDLEGIYANLDKLSGKVKTQLEANRDLAFFSRRLATIITDVSVNMDLDSCRQRPLDRPRIVNMFRELGFRSLVDRLPKDAGRIAESPSGDGNGGQLSLFGEAPSEAGAPSPEESQVGVLVGAEPPEPAVPDAAPEAVSYSAVCTEAELDAMIEEMRSSSIFAFDLETTGLDPLRADMVGISFCARAGVAYYVPVGHLPASSLGLGLLTMEPSDAEEEELPQIPLGTVIERLKSLLEDEKQPKCAHNGKYDMLALARYGIEVKGLVFDSMIAAYLLEGTQRALGLKDLSWSRLSIEMKSYAALAGKGKNAVTLDQVPIKKVAEYSCADADITYRLKGNLEPELRSTGLVDLFERVEMPLVPVLAEMEKAGVALDVDYLKLLSAELYQRIRELESSICNEAGHTFNLSSTQQLATVLFSELKLSPTRKTKTGYSTDADVLEELRGTHPIIEMILEHRQMVKLKSTYVDALPLLVNPRTGRVHTSFNQTIASTGRLSSSDPNLQNIPIRTEMGRRVRKAFVSQDPCCLLFSADYSQIELRVLAHMTGDPALVGAFQRGEDIHAATAAQVYGIPLSDVTRTERRIAKTVNFGVLYGMSDYGLARDTGLTRKEAAQFIESYFLRYGSVSQFFETIKAQAVEKGYVSTLLGRRRYIPEIRAAHRGLRQSAERMAINMPIQGTAADIIKIAMINLDHFLRERKLRSRMILQVHDELVFEADRDELELLAAEVKRIMESAMSLNVPLVVDSKVGPNWDEMTPMFL